MMVSSCGVPADRQLIPGRPALQLDQQEIYLDATLDKIANLFR